MNRLILIGNGFDLAHGLKTSYTDFIKGYLVTGFSKAITDRSYEDFLIRIDLRYPGDFNPDFVRKQHFTNVKEMIDFFYDKNDLEKLQREKIKLVKGELQDYINPFTFVIKSSFLLHLLRECQNHRWVDIENEYYSSLKEILYADHDNAKPKGSRLKELNDSMSCLISNLEQYLSILETPGTNDSFKTHLNELIIPTDILLKTRGIVRANPRPKKYMVLNFNYTSTIERYIRPDDVNYIHGKLGDKKNKLIFGFGDELDQDYLKMELEKTKGYFTYIKSFWYFKTHNYYNLMRFIDSDEFQVYIWGHSCGLSDRTMLNMIFEHEHCKSIKIFYYKKGDDNNFTDITEEISRHFKDKQIMRQKILHFDLSSPLPQV